MAIGQVEITGWTETDGRQRVLSEFPASEFS